MNFYNPSPDQRKADKEREEANIRKIASEANKQTVNDWLFRPIILEFFKKLLFVAIPFIVGVYFSDIKSMLSSNLGNTQQQKQEEQIKKP